MGRPVRFNIHPKKTDIYDNIALAEMPEGLQGEGYFATKFEKIVGLARMNSIWPLPFATSCCGIEFMATMASHYDLSRFGAGGKSGCGSKCVPWQRETQTDYGLYFSHR